MFQNLTIYTFKHHEIWKGGDSNDDYMAFHIYCTLPTNTSVVDELIWKLESDTFYFVGFRM